MPYLLLKPCNLFFFSCILLLFGWALSFFHALLTLTFSYFHLGGHFLFFNVLLTLMCMSNFQAREFTFSLIHSFTLLLKIAHFKKQPCSRCSLQKSDLEQIALYKRVTVSKLLLSLFTKECPERIALVALYKRAMWANFLWFEWIIRKNEWFLCFWQCSPFYAQEQIALIAFHSFALF